MLAGLGLGFAPLLAQETEPGTAEVTGFAGFVSGIGTHGTIGGDLAYAHTKRLLLVGEFAFIPAGSEAAGVVKASAKAYDFNGGIHYQFKIKEPKAVPYVAGGLGVLHSTGSVKVSGFGGAFSQSASATDFYLNFGGGLRYYISDHWGIRPELKIYAGDDTFMRLAIGIFYQFGKR